MKFLLGKKSHMTQIFTDDGRVISGTIIEAGPMVATQVKTTATDGYEAVQFGFGLRSLKRTTKALKGHLRAVLPAPDKAFLILREAKVKTDIEIKVGDNFKASIFKEGDKVNVSSISKGKGFQGVVKRHGFKGGPRTHGQKHSEREPGSIGAGGMQRVFKGTRMAGRMGGDRVTIKNAKIIRVDEANNLLFIKGAVPGRRGTLVEIQAV